MTPLNPFVLLKFEPRPWIDQEELKARFLELSKLQHPDQQEVGAGARLDAEQKLQQLNQANQILSDDVQRIKALLELGNESDGDRAQGVPDSILSLFSEVTPVIHEADRSLKVADQATTALERAMVQGQVMEQALAVQKAAGSVGAARERLLEKIRDLDQKWQDDADFERLKQVYSELVYVVRWARQLDERQFRLLSF
ncbi:MAG: DnaJ domain-containing protein [Verrucomicrobiota bacterium]